jgi:hypothetical protein
MSLIQFLLNYLRNVINSTKPLYILINMYLRNIKIII